MPLLQVKAAICLQSLKDKSELGNKQKELRLETKHKHLADFRQPVQQTIWNNTLHWVKAAVQGEALLLCVGTKACSAVNIQEKDAASVSQRLQRALLIEVVARDEQHTSDN